MFNYRDVLPILVDINLIIIISIYIISLCLYLTNKENKTKLINYLYFLDLIIFTIVIINSYINGKFNLNTYILAIYAFLKIVYIIKSKKKLGININSINLLFGISLIQITSLFFIPNIFYILNILINLTITKKVYVECLNKTYKKVNKNLNKLSKNKTNLSKIENKINKEKLLQQEAKNKILNLDSKINKAISEVDMPIFTLDKKNQINSSNEAFKLELYKNNIEVLNDIYLYLDKMFINSTDAIELIRKSYDYNQESIELYTNEDKIYKFTCVNDTYKNETIKICILNDITQTTVIQKKLIESEEKYRKLMDILSDGVIIHDMNNVTYINEAALSLFSLDCENKSVRIDDIKNKIDKKSIEKFKRNIKFVNEGKIEKLSNKIKTVNGLFIELITTKININDTNKLLTIAIDISSIEKAIRELEGSKKSYKMLIQNLPEGIVVIDKKSKNYIYQNRAMIKILKSSGIESVSKIINDYIKDEKFGVSKKYNFKNKEISSVSLTMIDTKDENQLVGIIRCLDEEERIKAALEELDSINMQYEVKNEFLTTISQNLKNPIRTIATANNLLESNKFKYESKYINNYNKLIKRNCNRLQRLINNMNEIVEIENGFYSMEYTNCDIVKFIRSIVYEANKYLEDKGIDIKFKSSIDKKIMQIDTDKIERIILNLLSNSIKFSDIGSQIMVNIGESDNYINISVEDNGVGIPKDKLNFIFTKFAQVDKTLSRNAEGSGVGLSLVKRFTELHEGKVEVESKEGTGSKFTIKLLNNDKKRLKESKKSNKLSIDSEKMHIEFADIYF